MDEPGSQASPALEAQLEELLGESVSEAREREATVFDTLTHQCNGAFVLFGAGNLGRKTLAGMRSIGLEPLAFADNSAESWGTSVDGVRVLSPQEAAGRFGDSAGFITTIWRAAGGDRQESRERQLRSLGCRVVLPFGYLFWKRPEVFLPQGSMALPHTMLEHADALRKVWRLWSDDDSRLEFLSQLRFRLRFDLAGLRAPAGHAQYFAEDLFELGDREVFVDCGAFDGDTIEDFLARRGSAFSAIYAYEPDERNASRLRERVDRLHIVAARRIVIRPVAVGARYETLRFSDGGTVGSRVVEDGRASVDCVPLDGDLVHDPTFIKMDVEGSELRALEGAQKTIRHNRPILAISVYHRPEDLHTVPLYIDALSGDYRYFLRAHDNDGWELVCYAIPTGRLVGPP